MKKKILILFIFAFMMFPLFSCNGNNDFASWNECKSLTDLKNYVSDTTNKNSKKYIPVEDRIAVFDMDGTLYGELFPEYLEYLMLEYRALDDSTYTAPEDVKEVALQIRESGKTYKTPDVSGFDMIHANAAAKAYSGMTVKKFEDYTKAFLNREVEAFSGMTYKQAFYKPMIEVVKFLQKNDFTTYVVSGSDRALCRVLVCDVLNIPYSQVIGMDVRYKATNQEITTGNANKDGLNYQYTKDDTLIRTDEVLTKNLKMNKVLNINEEIGKQPVLSFGNSSGDVSMHEYTTTNNKYESRAYMLVADDTKRDHADMVETNKRIDSWNKYGFNIISMHDDFKTIYGDNVTMKN